MNNGCPNPKSNKMLEITTDSSIIEHRNNVFNIGQCDIIPNDPFIPAPVEYSSRPYFHSTTITNHRYVYDEEGKALLIPEYIMSNLSEISIHDILHHTSKSRNFDDSILFATPKSNEEYRYTTYSLVLSEEQMRNEFNEELIWCQHQTQYYLTSFAPVVGYHVLCFHHYPDVQQSLVIAYMHGMNADIIQSVRYKNRKTCRVRNIEEHYENMCHPFIQNVSHFQSLYSFCILFVF